MKLHDINPDALAQEVGDALEQHLGRLAVPAAPGLTVHVSGSARGAGIALTAADLCRYAQHGTLGDWPDASCAIDAAQEVVETLYSRPADRLAAEGAEEDGGAWWAAIESGTGLGLVVQAALARAWAETGASPVPLGWLAPLSGVSASRLRQLVIGGEIRAQVVAGASSRVQVVEAAEARRYLESRGVKFSVKTDES